MASGYKRSADAEENGSGGKRYNTGGNEPLLKLLVPSYTVGALLGKGGALLNDIKSTYGGNIRISAGKEYYPGTQERVVVLTGENDQIIGMNNHVMEKLQDPGRDSTMRNVSIDTDRAKKVKIVLTNDAAGLLIGRGGLTIKAIQEESKAKITIGMPDKSTVPGERVLTMSGSYDERAEGCRQIINLIANVPSNMSNTILRYPGGNMESNVGQVGNVGFRGMGEGKPAPSQKGTSYQSGANKLQAKVEIQIEVPNVLVGPILGKGGSIIRDFNQRSGARFKFSDKSDDENRTLTISGNVDQAYNAYSLVSERVEQLGDMPNTQVGNTQQNVQSYQVQDNNYNYPSY